MKNDEMMVLALAGVAVFLILKAGGVKATTGTKSAGSGLSGEWAQLIGNTASTGDPGYGWQYYTDGTAISPDGTYYHNGVAVWAP